MTRLAAPAVLVALLAVPAAAQVPRTFPVDRSYKAVSIGARDVQNAGITLRVQREADGGRPWRWKRRLQSVDRFCHDPRACH